MRKGKIIMLLWGIKIINLKKEERKKENQTFRNPPTHLHSKQIKNPKSKLFYNLWLWLVNFLHLSVDFKVHLDLLLLFFFLIFFLDKVFFSFFCLLFILF